MILSKKVQEEAFASRQLGVFFFFKRSETSLVGAGGLLEMTCVRMLSCLNLA